MLFKKLGQNSPKQRAQIYVYLWASASLRRSFSYFNWASTDPKGRWVVPWDGKVALLPTPLSDAATATPPTAAPLLLDPGEFLSIFCWCFGLSAGGWTGWKSASGIRMCFPHHQVGGTGAKTSVEEKARIKELNGKGRRWRTIGGKKQK